MVRVIADVRRQMDPRERLTAGQALAREGRYEDALREYVWFHEHALEHDRSYYGVRLSFALGYWLDLAKDYPAAGAKLREIRDRKTEVLASGGGDRALFHDVQSINKKIGEDDKTFQLFKAMVERSPLLATACADIATEALVRVKAFALAERFSDPPEDALLRYSDQLNADVADLAGDRDHKARRLDAYTHIYCQQVAMTIAILRGVKKTEDARLCREWAEVLVDAPRVRRRVAMMLAERYDA